MRTWQFSVLTGLLFMIVLLAALPIVTPVRAAPSWEYTVVAIPDEKVTTQMNEWGEARWELVFARRAVGGMGEDRTASYEVILKRPK